MTDTITLIRAQYPTPMAERDSTEALGEYCVGTAVCRYYGFEVLDFVGEHELASCLAQMNPALDGPPEEDNEEEAPPRAWQWASAITEAVDARDFEEAWRLAGLALAATAETEPPPG